MPMKRYGDLIKLFNANILHQLQGMRIVPGPGDIMELSFSSKMLSTLLKYPRNAARGRVDCTISWEFTDFV